MEVGKEWLNIFPALSESQKRWVAGALSLEIGHGGVLIVQEISGLSRPTIIKGRKEVKSAKVPFELGNCSPPRKGAFRLMLG